MKSLIRNILIFYVILALTGKILAQKNTHPCLILTKEAVIDIQSKMGKLPLLDKSIDKLKKNIDQEIQKSIDVPVPKDPAGGYTHNQHKQNYLNMYGAGILWQLTQNESYAKYVKEMLIKYATLYPTLGLHPIDKSYAPGKLFWQSLNEAVWMVYTSQAYDCIYDYLKPDERKKIEKDLLIPYANFLSIETPKVFNLIHNHGVWAVAAVGMAGFAMNNEDLVNKAFNGVEGFESKDGLKPGFFTQLSELFSPDGYYTEGPYYQRYALLPFMLFAQAIENNKPGLKIFEYRNEILKKAVLTTLQLTNNDGKFFPLNDAIKSMSYLAPELITSVDIIYNQYPADYALLSIAKEQDEVIISAGGLKVAEDIASNKAVPFERKSQEFTDGVDGKEGGIGVLRSKSDNSEPCVVMKYPSQGMGHGHFDRLSIIFYNNGNEIFQDYGAARFVNVLYKQGGRYLPENETWAKQTIAHNTVVVDSSSQYDANVKTANKYHADRWFFDALNPEIQIMSAKENNAYPGIKMQRTIALISDKQLFDNEIIVDIYRIESENKHCYDMPYFYKGQFMHTNIEYQPNTSEKRALGTTNGYQHLWANAQGFASDSIFKLIWLNEHHFYSITSEVKPNTQIIFANIGAGDPEFNLRNEPCLIFRQKDAKNQVFATVIESHGSTNPVTEVTNNINGNVKSVRTLYNDNDYTIVEISSNSAQKIYLAISNENADKSKQHSISVEGKKLIWEGPYHLFKNI
ncbi:MAG: alginate lyase family protein [Bacteroidales bacterium]|nr:alginate lyase family protein [Bacteroidales bacterium]